MYKGYANYASFRLSRYFPDFFVFLCIYHEVCLHTLLSSSVLASDICCYCKYIFVNPSRLGQQIGYLYRVLLDIADIFSFKTFIDHGICQFHLLSNGVEVCPSVNVGQQIFCSLGHVGGHLNAFIFLWTMMANVFDHFLVHIRVTHFNVAHLLRKSNRWVQMMGLQQCKVLYVPCIVK